ncbi:MAG: esterase family protein [Defluviitaleaceae bacterium]|nr:esterase family protein [Defluviitaleaceae bacterium]
MARLSATFTAMSLRMTTHAEILIPENIPPDENEPLKVLYLLHGLTGGCTDWLDKTRIAYYAQQQRFIVVMPEVQNSFYTDMAFGGSYFTYIAHELPSLVEQFINVKHTRARTYIAGLSMGGYGAAKVALTRPEFFTACAAFSGALHAEGLFKQMPEMDEWHKKLAMGIAGTELKVPEGGCLFQLAGALADKPVKPRVLVTCGDKDFLLEANRAFDAHMKALPFEYAYREWPGDHDWDFWEQSLPVMFDFFNKEGDFA